MGHERRKEALCNAIRGWISYFKYADARNNLIAIEKWLNRRIRMCIWKSWKRIRTRTRNLIWCGIEEGKAYEWGSTSKGYWAVAGSAIMQVAASSRNLARAGYPSLMGYYEKYHCR